MTEQRPKTSKKTDITLGFVREVATLAAAGAPKSHIIKSLNTTQFIVNEVLAMPDCKSFIDEINKEAIEEAKLTVRKGVASLAAEAVKVVQDNLKKGSLEAAKTVFKVLGVDGNNEDVSQNNSFQLVLATDKGHETITIKDAKREIQE